MIVEIQSSNLRFVVAAVYRPHSDSMASFEDRLFDLLNREFRGQLVRLIKSRVADE